jgi:lipopolysaccharide heptosyltransferase II
LFQHLDIYDRRERVAVGMADLALAATAWPLALLRRRRDGDPRRILLLRLERIGDLLMSLGAIRAVRELAPHAVVDLVVGSWNEAVARTISGIDRVQVLDVPWLARGGIGFPGARLGAQALGWRRQHYDLAINFEGDIRSHLLMAASLAPRLVGFDMAGGGPLLTHRVHHDPRKHTASNSLALVERAFDLAPGSLAGPFDPGGASRWQLQVPLEAQAAADARLSALALPAGKPVVAVHVPGGREIKQWPVERFAEVARALARTHDASILLTGAGSDERIVQQAAGALGDVPRVHVLAGTLDLLTLAGVLARCALLVTGDTGPMHMAAAVSTPVVAVFGLSSPARYAPLSPNAQVVRIDLPCAPCNQVRKPPARCVGHTPDCLEGLHAQQVIDAAHAVLGRPVALGARGA